MLHVMSRAFEVLASSPAPGDHSVARNEADPPDAASTNTEVDASAVASDACDSDGTGVADGLHISPDSVALVHGGSAPLPVLVVDFNGVDALPEPGSVPWGTARWRRIAV
jgi:hypothetical protein